VQKSLESEESGEESKRLRTVVLKTGWLNTNFCGIELCMVSWNVLVVKCLLEVFCICEL